MERERERDLTFSLEDGRGGGGGGPGGGGSHLAEKFQLFTKTVIIATLLVPLDSSLKCYDHLLF